MKKIVIITGLTGSGKSRLAIDIAKRFNGEIVSADSVQIYKGLNIGSAKETLESMQGIKHHLIDIKEPTETYNVGEFVHDCLDAVKQIEAQGKLPIIVGGTAMYIKALLNGYTLGDTTSHPEFRQKYQLIAETKGNLAVWEELNKLNPEKAKTVHHNNLKRVIRYLEIEAYGSFETKTELPLKNYEVLSVGIVADRNLIYQKINERVDEMIDAGLEDEIKHLVNSGVKEGMQSVLSIGYKEWFAYLNKLQGREETINLIKQHTRNYCKRQLTFLKTISNLEMCDYATAQTKIENFLKE